jgi:hypothetical protein
VVGLQVGKQHLHRLSGIVRFCQVVQALRRPLRLLARKLSPLAGRSQSATFRSASLLSLLRFGPARPSSGQVKKPTEKHGK